MVVLKVPDLLVVIGPSGVGKSTVMSRLAAMGLIRVLPTWTTRPGRHYEVTGSSDHVFCSNEAFDEQLRAGYFLDTVSLFGLEHRYGLPRLPKRNEGEPIPVLMLRSMLLARLSQHYSNYIVYQFEAPFERVQAHMALREQHDGPQGTRLLDFERESKLGRSHAHRVIDTAPGVEAAVQQAVEFLERDFMVSQ